MTIGRRQHDPVEALHRLHRVGQAEWYDHAIRVAATTEATNVGQRPGTPSVTAVVCSKFGGIDEGRVGYFSPTPGPGP
jgi:hypothetical protein